MENGKKTPEHMVGKLASMSRNPEQKVRHLTSVLTSIRKMHRLIIAERDSDKLLSGVCELLVQTRGYHFAWIGTVAEGTHDVTPVAEAGAGKGYLEDARITWDDSPAGMGPTGTALKTGRLTVARDIANDPKYKPWRDRALRFGFCSSAAVPVLVDDKLFGAINVYSEYADCFCDEEAELLSHVAGAVGVALVAIDWERKRGLAVDGLRIGLEKIRSALEVLSKP